jgi:hypothetical protein
VAQPSNIQQHKFKEIENDQIYRNSPKRNDLLQDQLKKSIGVEVTLVLDVKTRWNSIIAMLDSFFKVIINKPLL